MPKARTSTTASDVLLEQARSAEPGLKDVDLLDHARSALRAEHRAGEVDRSYRVFADLPLETEDEWGNLENFLGSVEDS